MAYRIVALLLAVLLPLLLATPVPEATGLAVTGQQGQQTSEDQGAAAVSPTAERAVGTTLDLVGTSEEAVDAGDEVDPEVTANFSSSSSSSSSSSASSSASSSSSSASSSSSSSASSSSSSASSSSTTSSSPSSSSSSPSSSTASSSSFNASSSDPLATEVSTGSNLSTNVPADMTTRATTTTVSATGSETVTVTQATAERENPITSIGGSRAMTSRAENVSVADASSSEEGQSIDEYLHTAEAEGTSIASQALQTTTTTTGGAHLVTDQPRLPTQPHLETSSALAQDPTQHAQTQQPHPLETTDQPRPPTITQQPSPAATEMTPATHFQSQIQVKVQIFVDGVAQGPGYIVNGINRNGQIEVQVFVNTVPQS